MLLISKWSLSESCRELVVVSQLVNFVDHVICPSLVEWWVSNSFQIFVLLVSISSVSLHYHSFIYSASQPVVKPVIQSARQSVGYSASQIDNQSIRLSVNHFIFRVIFNQSINRSITQLIIWWSVNQLLSPVNTWTQNLSFLNNGKTSAVAYRQDALGFPRKRTLTPF